MKILKKLTSRDGSVKFLFGLEDKNSVEALYMNDKNFELTYHSTVCVSSQVGCKLGCAFCATGKQGYVRNLMPHEITGQATLCNEHCMSSGLLPIDAVVFAGMGEPLLNYPNVKEAIHKIYSELGICKFELATVGVVPRIYQMLDDFKSKHIHIRLNLSLHASTDELRRKLIPFASEYDMDTILGAAVEYSRASGSKARIRYTLFKGLNDTDQDIERLCRLLEGKPLKLVVSQYNENDIPGLTAPSMPEVLEFHEKIAQRIECGVFYNFGSDIHGGCGQLRQAYAG